MGDLRKDYVIDRFVIVSQENHDDADSNPGRA